MIDKEIEKQLEQMEQQQKKTKKTKGQSLVEYGLILALVSVVAITVLTTMGEQIKTTVETVTGQIERANNIAQNG